MKINRLFEIVYLLTDKKEITARELAEHFEISTRTVYRDIEVLSTAGIPIYMKKGKGGGISILPNFVLNKTVLTEEEKVDVLSSLGALSSVGQEQSSTALNKLSSLFGRLNPDWIEIDFASWVNSGTVHETFEKLKEAVLLGQVVSFSYQSTKGEEQRTVEPLKLGYKGHSWYLYGFCRMREDYRFFKLSRIRELKVTEELFTRAAPKKIFPDSTVNVFKEDLITLKLKIAPEMGYRVYDEFEIIEKLEDGSFVVERSYPTGDWLVPYIASFGEYCEILAPERERELIKKALGNMLNKYL